MIYVYKFKPKLFIIFCLDLEKLLPQLTPIETVFVDQAAKANETSARITCLLEKYNGIVCFLNII